MCRHRQCSIIALLPHAFTQQHGLRRRLFGAAFGAARAPRRLQPVRVHGDDKGRVVVRAGPVDEIVGRCFTVMGVRPFLQRRLAVGRGGPCLHETAGPKSLHERHCARDAPVEIDCGDDTFHHVGTDALHAFCVDVMKSGPAKMKSANPISSATAAHVAPLTRPFSRTDNSPSLASGNIVNKRSATHNPSTRSPRNSNRS